MFLRPTRGMFLGFLLLGFGQSLSAQKKDVQKLQPISVCEALKKRHALHSKIVRVQGIYESGGHGSFLMSDSCKDDCFVIKGVAAPCMIHLRGNFSKEYSDSMIQFRVRLKKYEEQWKLKREDLLLTVLVEGVFETKPDEELFIGVDYRKKLHLNGFGDGNAFPAELSIKTIKLVSAQPR